MRARLRLALAVLLLLGGSLSACQTTPPAAASTPVTVQLSWMHTAQFAGFYAANRNGNYTAEGLAATFIAGGPTVDRLQPVLDGTAQFGVASGPELVVARAQGKPVRAIAAIFRRDPFVFFALAESGITRPEDFAGKVIQVRPRAYPIFRAMMARVGVTPDQYTEDAQASYTALFSRTVDVATGYVTDQVMTAQRAGHALNIIYPDDCGVHNYGDILFATDNLIAADPDLVQRFVRATLKGWTYAVEHPDAVGALVVAYQPEADAALENAKMTASLPLLITGEDSLAWMDAEVWAGMEKTLREQGIIAQPVDVSQIFTLQFVSRTR